MIYCLVLFLGIFLWQECHSFAPSKALVVRNFNGKTKLHVLSTLEEEDGNGEEDNTNNNDRDVGSMKFGGSNSNDDTTANYRQRAVIQGGGASSLITEWRDQLKYSPPPPLTTTRRIRMEKEIALLEQLASATNKNSERQLASLWIAEQGREAEKVLEVATALIRQGHPQAEEMLLDLIQTNGPHFVAPLQLLASLYLEQGRFQDCKDLSEMVLMQKPWHVGALVEVYNACKALDDYEGMMKWDGEQLPENDGTTTRKQWAQRMATKARLALHNSEQGLQSHFDISTVVGVDANKSIVLEDEFGNEAWQ